VVPLTSHDSVVEAAVADAIVVEAVPVFVAAAVDYLSALCELLMPY